MNRRFLIALSTGLMLLTVPGVAPAGEPGIELEVLLQDSMSWNGAALPAYPQGTPQITIVRISIPPGQALPEHKHPVINGGVLLSGELTVRTESGQQVRIEAGDPLLEVVDTWHFGTNTGQVAAEVIVFYVGTPGVPTTIRRESPP